MKDNSECNSVLVVSRLMFANKNISRCGDNSIPPIDKHFIGPKALRASALL